MENRRAAERRADARSADLRGAEDRALRDADLGDVGGGVAIPEATGFVDPTDDVSKKSGRKVKKPNTVTRKFI